MNSLDLARVRADAAKEEARAYLMFFRARDAREQAREQRELVSSMRARLRSARAARSP